MTGNMKKVISVIRELGLAEKKPNLLLFTLPASELKTATSGQFKITPSTFTMSYSISIDRPAQVSRSMVSSNDR